MNDEPHAKRGIGTAPRLAEAPAEARPARRRRIGTLAAAAPDPRFFVILHDDKQRRARRPFDAAYRIALLWRKDFRPAVYFGAFGGI